jgi:hypothetical protein
MTPAFFQERDPSLRFDWDRILMYGIHERSYILKIQRGAGAVSSSSTVRACISKQCFGSGPAWIRIKLTPGYGYVVEIWIRIEGLYRFFSLHFLL